MKSKDIAIALLLLGALVCAIVIGVVTDRLGSSTELGVPAEKVDIIITEVCAKNTDIIEDSQGKSSDYIEIYNRGDDCNLHGFTLSDGTKSSEPFGDTPFGAGEYMVLFVDRDSCGFSISASGGENVFLYNRDGSTAAQVTVSPMEENQVMEWDGKSYVLSYRPTPGFPNTDEGYEGFTVGVPDPSPALVINEILTSNRYALPDKNGVFSDVVELHNVSGTALSIGGYGLSDKADERYRYMLPAMTLEAGGFVLVFCDGGLAGADGELHASFALSVGETLYLSSPEGKYISAEVTATQNDRSLSLVDGKYNETAVSLGYPNSESGETAFADSRVYEDAPLYISEILLSGDGTPVNGSFADAVELCNRSQGEISTKGWYLTDGDDPLRYALPEMTLASGECVVIICDGGDEEWHAPFALSEGEALVLTAPDYRHSTAVMLSSAGQGMSLSAVEGGEELAYKSGEVTIGFANTDAGRAEYLKASLPKGLIISELISSNKSSLRGSYGTCCDWVELYNASQSPIDLSGYYLSDDSDEPYMGALPDYTLAAGEYYIVFLSTDSENLLKGYPVLPFGLSSGGDSLYLTKGGRAEDYVIIPTLATDVSYGRPDGASGFDTLATVTPHTSNGKAAAETAELTVGTAQGVYNDVDYVDVVFSSTGTVYYTTDCTQPTTLSNVYTKPIRVTKTTVIRAFAAERGKKNSPVQAFSYIVNENHTLPVASLVTTPSNLWDEKTGIYVMGPNASSKAPYVGANFWNSWEKEASVALFEDSGSFSLPCGIRIFGGFSRQQPMKSLSCFFRAKYGASQLDYPLFGEDGLDSYEAFIFRCTGQDYNLARMRDPLLTELASTAMYMPVQKNKAVILYLNGQYWGIYYLREKINENYIAGNFNVTKEEVTLDRLQGSTAEYKALLNYVKTHNLSNPEYFAYVESQVDIDQYANFVAAQIYIANLDNGNVKFFKTDSGKWTWIMFDVDYSVMSTSNDTVSDHLNPAGTGRNDYFPTTFVTAMLKSPVFREKLIKSFAWQIENVWNKERVNEAIDRYYNMLKPEKARDGERWSISSSRWESSVQVIRSFFNNREAYIVKYVQNWFGLSDAQMKSYGFNI